MKKNTNTVRAAWIAALGALVVTTGCSAMKKDGEEGTATRAALDYLKKHGVTAPV